ncbi:MAG: hypothetical protein NW202_10690 [Nitrospira sp.]|nr:hypothetical protein [Nitrospira sp.]
MISQMAASEMESNDVERWALAAAGAAERGEWDRVEECFQEREAAMSRAVLSHDQIERLLAVDRRIQAQVFVARAAVAEQLRQSFATRLKLKGLRSGIGEFGGSSAILRMKA